MDLSHLMCSEITFRENPVLVGAITAGMVIFWVAVPFLVRHLSGWVELKAALPEVAGEKPPHQAQVLCEKVTIGPGGARRVSLPGTAKCGPAGMWLSSLGLTGFVMKELFIPSSRIVRVNGTTLHLCREDGSRIVEMQCSTALAAAAAGDQDRAGA